MDKNCDLCLLKSDMFDKDLNEDDIDISIYVENDNLNFSNIEDACSLMKTRQEFLKEIEYIADEETTFSTKEKTRMKAKEHEFFTKIARFERKLAHERISELLSELSNLTDKIIMSDSDFLSEPDFSVVPKMKKAYNYVLIDKVKFTLMENNLCFICEIFVNRSSYGKNFLFKTPNDIYYELETLTTKPDYLSIHRIGHNPYAICSNFKVTS